MDEEIIQELFKKDDEIGKLQAYVFKMENANNILKSTINNLINMKCKRGESSYSLNTSLDCSLRKNLQLINIFEHTQCGENVMESTSEYLLALLIGIKKDQIPCCILDNHNILYNSEDIGTYIVCTGDEFNTKIYECVSNYLCSKFQNELVNDTNDLTVNVINTILNKSMFFKVMKRTLQKYKSS